jgi:hypothetical protein
LTDAVKRGWAQPGGPISPERMGLLVASKRD